MVFRFQFQELRMDVLHGEVHDMENNEQDQDYSTVSHRTTGKTSLQVRLRRVFFRTGSMILDDQQDGRRHMRRHTAEHDQADDPEKSIG